MISIALTNQQLIEVRDKLRSMNLDPLSGKLPTRDGVSLTYAIEVEVPRVNVTVLKRPFFVSEKMIEATLRDLLKLR